ncbi:hypothetical protein C8034_v012068 [Colletotrichum sidae]|uniref:Uncharacterized protein n=1 Tax=Colletotrichum sidae TaxID=1347389 RepID=A0A4R8TJT1_9PEZI|nr:hypothetical protein C8034_v012068 [Colletotrichum sidae]
MRSERVSALGLLAGAIATAAARPDVRARSQLMRRQNAQDCMEDLEDILDNAPTTSLWPATGCDFTSTLSGTQLASNYASFRSRMASWYNDDLDDISKIERSCTQYASVFSQIRYCYVTGPYPTTAASTSSSAAAATTAAASSTTTSTATTSSSTPSSTATPGPDSGLDSGAKAGLAIGIVLAVLLAMFIGWKFLQRYRSSRLDGAGSASNGAVGPDMQSAAAIGAAGAVGAGAGLAAKNLRPPETSVYAFKSELSGDSRPISELDPAAAVAAPRSTGPPRGIAELDPDPPTQLSELPADNYDPTAHSAPPPAYVSPLVGSDHGNTLNSAISPLSPDSSTMERQGLGISNGQEMGQVVHRRIRHGLFRPPVHAAPSSNNVLSRSPAMDTLNANVIIIALLATIAGIQLGMFCMGFIYLHLWIKKHDEI